jgi:hypothetical protein
MNCPALDEYGRPLFGSDDLNTVREHAKALIDEREKPYDAASEMWEAAFDGSFCESVAPRPRTLQGALAALGSPNGLG